MGNMKPCACKLCKRNVPHNHYLLCCLWYAPQAESGGCKTLIHYTAGREICVLAMRNNWYIKCLCILKPPSHYLCIHNTLAVIRYCNTACIHHITYLCKRFTLCAFCY